MCETLCCLFLSLCTSVSEGVTRSSLNKLYLMKRAIEGQLEILSYCLIVIMFYLPIMLVQSHMEVHELGAGALKCCLATLTLNTC